MLSYYSVFYQVLTMLVIVVVPGSGIIELDEAEIIIFFMSTEVL